MDTVQYLENDWNNRNKIRTPQGGHILTVPIDRRKTKGTNLNQIIIRGHDNPNMKDFWQNIHWRSIEVNYKKTPYFHYYESELKKMYLDNLWESLVDLCWFQFSLFKNWLGLDSKKIIRMSEFPFEGKKDHLILDHCLKLKGDAIVFGIFGRDYVNRSIFDKKGIKIYFQNYQHPQYQQRFKGFEPYMCILDLLCNHGPKSLDILLSGNITYNSLKNGDYWEK